MASVARVMRIQVISPRHYWVAQAVGAALAAFFAWACLGRAWPVGATFAAAGLIVLLAGRLVQLRFLPRRFDPAVQAAVAVIATVAALGVPKSAGAWGWGIIYSAIAMMLALRAADPLVHKLLIERLRRRARGGCCVRCGYDLRAIRSLHCPECGAPTIARRPLTGSGVAGAR